MRSNLTGQAERKKNFEELLDSLTAGVTSSLYLRLSQEMGNKQRFWRTADYTSSSAKSTSTILSPKWVSLHEACHEKIAAHLYRLSESSS